MTAGADENSDDDGDGTAGNDDQAPAAVDLADLVVSYGDRPVLEEASLSVESGTFLALVGPNGAGKTTLLRAINGLVTPDAGRVRVDGDDVSDLSARETARRVATVPQETGVSFDFAVREVVRMGRTAHRGRFEVATREDREAVERALARTDTAHLADRSMSAVSGGERQRILLARALAQDAPVLLLDEPTASLDINHQVATLDLVEDLVSAGRTVVAAIHDLDLAARYCDEMALLYDGTVRAAGGPGTVLTGEHLAEAVGAAPAVTENPLTGSPVVTALSADPTDRDRDRGITIHVVGRGRPAVRALGCLSAAGFSLSAGVLPVDDVAHETARGLGARTVTADPFGPVADATLEAARDLVRAADATVVAGAVDETARAVAAASDDPLVVGDTDDVGRGRPTDAADLVERVAAATGVGAAGD